MDACWEYLGCDKQDCIMHGRKDNRRCWEVEETLCNYPEMQDFRDEIDGKKEDACARSGCIYFKAAKDSGIA